MRTVPFLPAPETFYCVEINNGPAAESIGCNRTRGMNEETSVIISDIVCGVNYDVTITSFKRVGDGENSNVSFPGMKHTALENPRFYIEGYLKYV